MTVSEGENFTPALGCKDGDLPRHMMNKSPALCFGQARLWIMLPVDYTYDNIEEDTRSAVV